MQIKTFTSCISLLQANYEKMTTNTELLNLWYTALKHYPDEQFIEATKKIMLNEKFAPKLDTLAEYCSEIAAPTLTDTEGWGLVVKAVNQYGYMRAEEAMQSLPPTVRKAVEHMGGFKLICASEEPDVIRGQFNKCMSAVNQQERMSKREKGGIAKALELMNAEESILIESASYKRSSEDETNAGIAKVYEALRKAKGGM